MLAFSVTSVIALAMYLVLTLFSGNVGLWSVEELIAGAVLALVAGWVSRRVLVGEHGRGTPSPWRMLNPLRLLLFAAYFVGPFFVALARANVDVAYRIVTGRIRPGIVKFQSGLKTDLGRTLLANSITLTPGTLSVDVDDETGDFYVHWINVTDPEASAEAICGSFPAWARRIAE
jgi:multicomponent Na+:H+ antiporter subunit E